jgi:hypothetical protein
MIVQCFNDRALWLRANRAKLQSNKIAESRADQWLGVMGTTRS